MPLQKNVKSRVFWIFKKNVKTYSRTICHTMNYKKAVAIAKMTAQCALIGALKNFGTPDYAHGYFSQNFMALVLMVSSERALVSFYGPSIVTFLYLYAFQRYCCFCCPVYHVFPTPPLVSPKFPNVPLGIGGSPFGYKERRCWANCPCN